MENDSPYVMTPTEIVWGYVPGHAGELPPAVDTGLSPRQALEQVVREALLQPPCGVAFSGGRDSSLVLAVATHVARRDGLAEPVAITKVFPAAPETEESQWQEMVIRHLGIADWQRVTLDDEVDLLGPVARERLRRHGVVWPPTIQGDVPLLDLVPGGSLIDGEGGDEVLGVSAHRIVPITHLVRVPRPLRWRRIRLALEAVAPTGVRARQVRRRWGEIPVPWLRPAARESLIETWTDVELSQPLSFARSVRRVPRRRSQLLMARNRQFFARGHDVVISSPLLHPEFVHALARDGRVLGRGDRTVMLRSLVSDLLPDAVLSRTSKALFGEAFMARHTQEFAKSWTGHGVDTTMVDPGRLRLAWLSGGSNALTAALLQEAWLAGQRESQ